MSALSRRTLERHYALDLTDGKQICSRGCGTYPCHSVALADEVEELELELRRRAKVRMERAERFKAASNPSLRRPR